MPNTPFFTADADLIQATRVMLASHRVAGEMHVALPDAALGFLLAHLVAAYGEDTARHLARQPDALASIATAVRNAVAITQIIANPQ